MADGYEGLDASFANQLRALNAVCPFTIVSGARSNAEQTRLYDDWKAGKSSAPSVAKPGTSMHEKGLAADIHGDHQCFAQHAASVGLAFPVPGEPWHAQPAGTVKNSGQAYQGLAGGADGQPAVATGDPVAHALATLMDSVMGGGSTPDQQAASGVLAAPDTSTMAAAGSQPTSAPTGGTPTPTSGGGWQASLSPAERWILTRESGLNPTAQNPHSTAFGIWQGLESTRKQYLGADWQTTDPAKQLDAFRRYVADRYGTAEKAQAFWQEHGYY